MKDYARTLAVGSTLTWKSAFKRNEVTTETESAGKHSGSDSDSAKKKNICCDPTGKAHIKTKWSDAMAGRSPHRKKEECTLKRISESNITLPSIEEEWKTVNRGHKKPPTVNHATHCQIPVIINRYAQIETVRQMNKWHMDQ